MPARKKVDRNEFARLHKEGLTQKELAEKFGIASSNVIAISKELGLTRRSHTATPEQLAAWEAAINEGLSFIEIARTHHVSAATLRKYFPGRAWDKQRRAEMQPVWRAFRSPDLYKPYAYTPASEIEDERNLRAQEARRDHLSTYRARKKAA